MISIVGSINYDLVTTTEIVPEGGQTVHALDFETYHGGKGANTAIAVARLSPSSAHIAMVGRVGEDEFGPQLIAGLKDAGVDISHIQRCPHERTGVATILVETSGENRILVYPGANAKVVPEDVPAALLDSDYLMFQNEIPIETTLALLKAAEHKPVKTVYNPSPIKKLDSAVWSLVDILAVNADEAAMIAGMAVETQEQAYTALDKLLALGVKSTVIITLGARGAVYGTGTGSTSERGFVPTAKVDKVVDTTGAGDTFLAGTIAQLAQGEQLREAIEFATKAAAIVVSRPGAAGSIPTRDEIN